MASQADNQGAKFFGKDNPFELRELENRSLDATDEELAEAARCIENIFGDAHAWCGGWALRLRGSERRTEDLDVVVRAPSTASIWEQLKPYSSLMSSSIILYYYKHILEEGGDQFKIFVDLDEQRVVCVDVILAGRLHTPTLETRDDVDEVSALVNGTVVKKRVVSLRWQVSQKLHAIATRRKESDCTDLVWLMARYPEIGTWIQDEDESKRKAFFDWYYDNEMDDAEVDVMKRYLGLEGDKR